jgi:molybdopterin synthase catalytic subunit
MNQTLEEYLEQSVINRMFALQALEYFSKEVLKRKEEIFKQEHMLVHPEAWIKAAEDASKL